MVESIHTAVKLESSPRIAVRPRSFVKIFPSKRNPKERECDDKETEGGREEGTSEQVNRAIKCLSLVGDMIESPSLSSILSIVPSLLPFLPALFSLFYFYFFLFPVLAMWTSQ